MNEVQAAFGLLQLKHVNKAIDRRREVDSQYRKRLSSITGIFCPSLPADTIYNYAYFPIIIDKEYPISREELYEKFRQNGIYTRRYFYPLISDFPMYRGLPSAQHGNLAIATEVAAKVLCLPIYPALKSEDQDRIIKIIQEI